MAFEASKIEDVGFNPCFSGTYSRTLRDEAERRGDSRVSILVLVELTLELHQSNLHTEAVVSILVLVELTLELINGIYYLSNHIVSILVLVELTLEHCRFVDRRY